jgi:hypothetical protein
MVLVSEGLSEATKVAERERPRSSAERVPEETRTILLLYALVFPHRQLRIHHAHGFERDRHDDQ